MNSRSNYTVHLVLFAHRQQSQTTALGPWAGSPSDLAVSVLSGAEVRGDASLVSLDAVVPASHRTPLRVGGYAHFLLAVLFPLLAVLHAGVAALLLSDQTPLPYPRKLDTIQGFLLVVGVGLGANFGSPFGRVFVIRNMSDILLAFLALTLRLDDRGGFQRRLFTTAHSISTVRM